MHDIIVTRLVESERVLQQNRQAETSGFGTMLKSLVNRFSRPQAPKVASKTPAKPNAAHCSCLKGEPAR